MTESHIYRPLPRADLDELARAFVARDGDALARQLVANALETHDSAQVLEFALRSIDEFDDALVVASALEALSQVHWFGSGKPLRLDRLNAALANVSDHVRRDPLVRIKLNTLCEIMNDKHASLGLVGNFELSGEYIIETSGR